MGNNDNNKYLKPYKPGQSGNPLGKPKGSKNMKTILREMLETDINYEGKKVPTAFVVVSELVKKSIYHNNAKVQLEAIKEILDRSIGKPVQSNLNINADVERPDLTKLSESELQQLQSLLSKAGTTNEQ